MFSLVLGLFLQVSMAEEAPEQRAIQQYSKEQALVQLFRFPNIYVDLGPEVKNDMDVCRAAVEAYPPNAAYIAPELLEDRKFVESLLEVNVTVLRDLPESFQNDKVLLRRAIQIDPLAVLVMPEKYKDDDVLMKLAVRRKPLVYNFVSARLKKNRYLVSLALADADLKIWRAIPTEIQEDKEFLRPLVLKNCPLLQHTHSDDLDVVLDCASRDAEVFKYATERIKNDPSLLLEILRTHPSLLGSSDLNESKDYILNLLPEYKIKPAYLGASLKDDVDIAEQFLKMDPVFFQQFSESLRSNSNIASQAVSKSLFNFEYVGEELRGDYEFVSSIVEDNGSYIRYASDELRADKDMLSIAVSNDYKAFEYADDSLKTDLEWISGLLLLYPDKILRLSEVIEDKRWGLRKLPSLFRYDAGLVEIALGTRGESLAYAPEHFLIDRDMVLIAVEQNGLALEFADVSLQNDVKLVQKAVAQNSGALRFASIEILENEKLMKKWSKKNERIRSILREMGY